MNYRRKWYYITKLIVRLEKGIPTVVGVEKAVKNISNNMLVTIDAAQGKIFEGYANVL
ncbi:PEP-utilizing enzyme [Staphylococcus aureus]